MSTVYTVMTLVEISWHLFLVVGKYIKTLLFSLRGIVCMSQLIIKNKNIYIKTYWNLPYIILGNFFIKNRAVKFNAACT
jgi:hypothetical protein